jgi:protease PrsW
MTALVTEGMHWGVALIPVLVMLALFVWLDAFALMSLKEVVILLSLGALGALAAWPVSGRLLDTLPIGFSLYSRFVAPWIEEAIKALLMIIFF